MKDVIQNEMKKRKNFDELFIVVETMIFNYFETFGEVHFHQH